MIDLDQQYAWEMLNLLKKRNYEMQIFFFSHALLNLKFSWERNLPPATTNLVSSEVHFYHFTAMINL